MMAAKLATFILQTVGVPALREGNVIHLPFMSLEVVEACSGLRSLLSLFTLSIIYGYLMEKRVWVRVVLAFLTVPIAVVANGLRIFITGIVGEYWDPNKVQGFFHEFQGWLVFVVSLTLLFTLHRLINLIWKPAPDSKSESPSRSHAHAADLKSESERRYAQTPVSIWSPRFLIPALLMLTTAIGLQISKKDEIFPPRQPLSSLPAQIDGWRGTDESLDPPTLELLGYPEYVIRNYEATSGQEPDIGVFIAYYPSQKTGDTIHSPNHCLPGAGWVPTSREIVQLTAPDGTKFPANRYVISKLGEREIAISWVQAHGRAGANEYWAKYYLISDSVHMHRSDGALIRFISPMYPKESPDAAQARVMGLCNHFLPVLHNYIPR